MATFSVTPEFVKELVELAVKHEKQIKIGYIDKSGNVENRLVEPLDAQNPKMFGGHCLLRNNYRNFSYDRVVRIVLTDVNRTVDPTIYAKKTV